MKCFHQGQAAGANRRPAPRGVVVPLVLVLSFLARLGAEDFLDLDTTILTSLAATSDPGSASQATGFAEGQEVLVLWRQDSAPGPRIVLRRSTDGGESFGAPETISDASSVPDDLPLAIVKTQARLVAAWISAGEVVLASLTTGSEPWNLTRPFAGSTGRAEKVVLRTDGVALHVVAYRPDVSRGTASFSFTGSDDGSRFGAVQTLTDTTDQRVPWAADLGPGRFALAYVNRTNNAVRVAQGPAGGQLVDGVTPLAAPAGRQVVAAAVAVDGAGRTHLVDLETALDGTAPRIFHVLGTDQGVWEGPTELTWDARDLDHHGITLLREGSGVRVLWSLRSSSLDPFGATEVASRIVYNGHAGIVLGPPVNVSQTSNLESELTGARVDGGLVSVAFSYCLNSPAGAINCARNITRQVRVMAGDELFDPPDPVFYMQSFLDGPGSPGVVHVVGHESSPSDVVYARIPIGDCAGAGVPDFYAVLSGSAPDLNANLSPDACDIATGRSQDVDGDGVPDEVELDCDRNGVPDHHDLATGARADANGDGIPDACQSGSFECPVASPVVVQEVVLSTPGTTPIAPVAVALEKVLITSIKGMKNNDIKGAKNNDITEWSAWVDGPGRVWVRESQDAGATWSEPTDLSRGVQFPYTGFDYFPPPAIAVAGGIPTVAWPIYFEASPSFLAAATRSPVAGWGTPHLIVQFPPRYEPGPVLASRGGRLLALYRSARAAAVGPGNLYAGILSPDTGATWGPEIRIDAGEKEALCVTDEGLVHLATGGPLSASPGSQVALHSSTDGGDTWTHEVARSTAAVLEGIALAEAPDGTVCVVSHESPAGAPRRLVLSRFDPASSRWILRGKTLVEGSFHSVLATATPEGLAVAWGAGTVQAFSYFGTALGPARDVIGLPNPAFHVNETLRSDGRSVILEVNYRNGPQNRGPSIIAYAESIVGKWSPSQQLPWMLDGYHLRGKSLRGVGRRSSDGAAVFVELALPSLGSSGRDAIVSLLELSRTHSDEVVCICPPPGRTVRIDTLSPAFHSLSARLGEVPTTSEYDAASASREADGDTGLFKNTIYLNQSRQGDICIGVQGGPQAEDGRQPIEMTIRTLDFFLEGIEPATITAGEPQTFVLRGGKLDELAELHFEPTFAPPDDSLIVRDFFPVSDATSLTGPVVLPESGSYDLVIIGTNGEVVSIEAGVRASFVESLDTWSGGGWVTGPSAIRLQTEDLFELRVQNPTGGRAVARVTSTCEDAVLWLDGEEGSASNELLILCEGTETVVPFWYRAVLARPPADNECDMMISIFGEQPQDFIEDKELAGFAPAVAEAVLARERWSQLYLDVLPREAARNALSGVSPRSGLAAFQSLAWAAQGGGRGIIAGQVVEETTGESIIGVLVALLRDGTELRRATTDGEGQAAFGRLRAGTYEVVVGPTRQAVSVAEGSESLDTTGTWYALTADGTHPPLPAGTAWSLADPAPADLQARVPMAPERFFTLVQRHHVEVLGAFDPNDKVGPSGTGPDGLVGAAEDLVYTIHCENVPEATLPAKIVFIEDAIDPEVFDLTTFVFREVTIAERPDQTLDLLHLPGDIFSGYTRFRSPEALGYRETLTIAHRDASGAVLRTMEVLVTADLDLQTGIARWVIEDPSPDPLDGFLLPEDALHQGRLSVSFSVRARADLDPAECTRLENEAFIVFDANEPIQTSAWTNAVGNCPLDPGESLVSGPVPADGATDVAFDGLALRWRAPLIEACDVYLGREGVPLERIGEAVTGGALMLPGPLEPLTRYLWQVVPKRLGAELCGQGACAGCCPAFAFTTRPQYAAAATPSAPDPADGAGASVRPLLRWAPAANAFRYRVELWKAGDPEPAAPLATGLAAPGLQVEEPLAAGRYLWRVTALGALPGLDAAGPVWSFTVSTSSVTLRRGDANADGQADISDGISILGYLFQGSAAPTCLDAADTNDDGALDITDGIFLFNYLFLGGREPPAPSGACGDDPTGDELRCAAFAPCG